MHVPREQRQNVLVDHSKIVTTYKY